MSKRNEGDPHCFSCPVRKHRVLAELCGYLQLKHRNKCWKLECEHLDSDFVLEEYEKWKETYQK